MESMDWAVKCTCHKDHEEHPCPFEGEESVGGCTCCPWCKAQCEIEEPVT